MIDTENVPCPYCGLYNVHLQDCEIVRLGKAARKLEEVLDIKCAIESADPEAWMDAMVEEIKGKFAIADRAKEFCENPPKHLLEGEGTEYENGLCDGFYNANQAWIDRLREKGGE